VASTTWVAGCISLLWLCRCNTRLLHHRRQLVRVCRYLCNEISTTDSTDLSLKKRLQQFMHNTMYMNGTVHNACHLAAHKSHNRTVLAIAMLYLRLDRSRTEIKCSMKNRLGSSCNGAHYTPTMYTFSRVSVTDT
jgi:hypothetical protein